MANGRPTYLDGQFSIGLFQLRFVGAARNAQNLIVIIRLEIRHHDNDDGSTVLLFVCLYMLWWLIMMWLYCIRRVVDAVVHFCFCGGALTSDVSRRCAHRGCAFFAEEIACFIVSKSFEKRGMPGRRVDFSCGIHCSYCT